MLMLRLQHFPKVEVVEGDLQLWAESFCSIKSMGSPSTHPPPEEVEGVEAENTLLKS